MASFDFRALNERLKEMEEKSDEAAHQAAEAMATVVERRAKILLGASSHSRGTITPAPPGAPPSLISGQLRASVKRTHLGSVGAYRWEARVGGTTVYARIQELGGWAGKGHRSHLPPRPYLRPATLSSTENLSKVATAVFRKIIWH